MNYIHNNPVKFELVAKQEDYIYSSARYYAGEKGLLKFYLPKYLKRITDPKLRVADCKSAPAAAKIIAYPK